MIENYEVLDALPEGIICTDSAMKIVFWNQIIEVWTGIKKEEVTGRDLCEIFTSLKKKFYQLMIRQVLETGSTAVFSYQLHKKLFPITQKNGEPLYIQTQVTRTRSPDNKEEYNAVFYLQNISGLIQQIKQNKDVKDQVLKLVEQMKVTEEELRMTNEELQRAASTDPLTRLSNRRSMMFSLEKEVERYNRYKTNFSILLTDIDDFKKYNDKYGHACGDYLLSTLGEIFLKIVRPIDETCRWGGEEFLFLLPETETKEAGKLAERIRKTVEKYPFSFNGIAHKVTMTFGVSCFEGVTSLISMINKADEALYKGKDKGKNCVVLSPELIQ